MTKRIFRAIFIAAISVLIACILLIMSFLYNYFSNVQKSELKTELFLVSEAVEKSGISYLENIDINECRLTLIDADGDVLFDNQSDSNRMENHLEREEVRKAFENGYGEDERYSATLTEKTIYCAKKLSDNSVLRISVSQYTVLTIFLGTIQPIMIVLIIALVISFILASRLSKRIIRPLNEVDLDNPLENDIYDEISPLLSKIANQQKKIKKQADELNQHKREFSSITSNMNEGLILLGSDRKILSLNPAAKSFLADSSECIGKFFIEAERDSELINALKKVDSEGGGEVRTVRNGRIYQLNISCVSDMGEISGYVILIIDVTEKVNEEVRRKEFTANVSHELKTPLQSIMGSAELIENGIVRKDDIPQFIENIRRESARLLTLINDIIKLSGLDENTDLLKQEFDLYKVAEECISRLKVSAEKHNITVKLNGKSAIMTSVKTLVTEIVNNLIDNAIRYNKENGTVNVSISDKKIVVKDTGIGIPPEHQERIFERFYRVDKSRSKETGGTGLGLAIVKHAAEDIRAKIEMKSKVNVGTEVTVFFDAVHY